MARNPSDARRNRRTRARKTSSGQRRDKRPHRTKSSIDRAVYEPSPEQVRAVERLLQGIGVPEPQPFRPDDFQLAALEAIETNDVLVTAPTGSGKTWIAREEVRRLLEAGKRAWYTTPLKALTNSKYAEFQAEFGSEKVGILTGDRKENPSAPLIVGTTEIYRNQLFDSLRGDGEVAVDLVILDEAHFLSDEDRGHVWEEAIILSPQRIRLLMLSATVGRSHEFASWIEKVRGSTVTVISAGPRPVELRAAYLSEDLQLFPLFTEHGKFDRYLERFSSKRSRSAR